MAASLARVILVGNLTRDPELRYTTGGSAICNLSLAVNRRIKRGEEWTDEVSFFDVVVFGRRAETSAEYLSKGRPVLVEGDLVQRRWESQDGQKRSKIEVQARDVQFLGSKADSGYSNTGSTNNQSSNDGPPPVDDDDIPY